jgi:hypothetical protein
MSTNEATISATNVLAAFDLPVPKAAPAEPSEGGQSEAVFPSHATQGKKTATSTDLGTPCAEHTMPLGEQVHWIEPERLNPHPESERIYGTAIPAELRDSIATNGIRTPLIVAKGSMVVLSGNTRLKVALQERTAKVPVVFVEGDSTEEAELDLVLTHNVARDKTREMRVREYRAYLGIAKELAKQRASAPRGVTAEVQKFAPRKSREIAADKVGASHASLETGVKVVEAIDRLTDRGEKENAERLRKVLEEHGFSSAKNLAANQRWLLEDATTESTTKKRSQRKAKQHKADDSAARDEAPTECLPEEPLASDESHLVDEGLLPLVSGEASKVDLVLQQITEVESFLLNSNASRFSEEVRATIGRRIGSINAAALAAGFCIEAN